MGIGHLVTATAAGGVPRRGAAVAFGWLPAAEYLPAIRRWPDLAQNALIAGPNGAVEHNRYCRRFEGLLTRTQLAGAPAIRIVPLQVGAFTQWCTQQGRTPDGQARAEYAAQSARRNDRHVLVWPPGRNQPCWCGSGRKYKKCCAAPAVGDEFAAVSPGGPGTTR